MYIQEVRVEIRFFDFALVIMSHWKVLLEHCGTVIELEIEARSYADAYIKAGISYPNCSVISIKPIGKDKKGEQDS